MVALVTLITVVFGVLYAIWKCNKNKKIDSILGWVFVKMINSGFTLRFCIESYLMFALVSLANFTALEFNFAGISSFLFMTVVVGLLAVITYSLVYRVKLDEDELEDLKENDLEKVKKTLTRETYADKFAHLFSTLYLKETRSALLYPFIFMSRRLIYATILVFMSHLPTG